MNGLKPHSYWFRPEILLSGQYPGDHAPENTREKIRWLLRQGIRRFVDLTEENEITWRGEPLLPYAHLLAEEADAAHVSVEHLRLGIRDMDVPAVETMATILDCLDAYVAAGEPAYVHCLGGKGRTGTVVACYFVRHPELLPNKGDGDAAAERTLRHVLALRTAQSVPDAEDSPQTEVQFRFVRAWGG